MVADERSSPRVFHVVGSAAADPSRIGDREASALAGARYRRIVLGFVLDGSGSRWLSDDEIASGVLRAIDDDLEDSVVGIVSPWDRRPG